MKTNGYFKNLEKYWSANFLALLSSVNLFFVLTWALINIVCLAFSVTDFSTFFEESLEKIARALLLYLPALFSISCYLAACISLFYILMIISKKKWCVIASALPIITGWCVFFAQCQEDLNFEQGSAIILGLLFLPLSVICIPISIGIYLILLLLERISKFRVPLSLVSKNNIFKKYIQIFYWFYFVIVCGMFLFLIYGLSLT